jgi:hypothetical protein
MKPLTGRIAPKQNQQFYDAGNDRALFDQHSLLWQKSLPGLAGIAALRGVLIQAAGNLGEGEFPFSRTAEVLLQQQMVIFGGWRGMEPGCRTSARRWGQAVWFDQQIREQLPTQGHEMTQTCEVRYHEYLRFARILGLHSTRLPETLRAFNVWANASFIGREAEYYHQLGLSCVTELLPVCWPVNVAIIFHLLPEDFWEVYGRALGKDSARLASCVGRVITKLPFSGV